MKFSVKVSYADGSAVMATVVIADQVAFENAFDRPVSVLTTNFHMRDLAWMTWHSLHRAGKTGLDFDSWLLLVDEVAFSDTEEEIVPLETPPPTG